MVAQATLVKQANGLVTYFLTAWTDKYPNTPTEINRYKHRWGFQDMVSDLGYERAKEVIDYYFRTSRPSHPITYLFNNYDKFNLRMLEQEKDAKERARIRKETEERVRQWEEQIVNK